MLVLTWVLNNTTVAVIQLFLLDEFVNQSRISQLEYTSNKIDYPLMLDSTCMSGAMFQRTLVRVKTFLEQTELLRMKY